MAATGARANPRGGRLAPLRSSLCARCGVGFHGGADQSLEASFVDLLPFAEVDGPPRLPFQAGVEELLRVLERGSAKEGELHDLLVRLAGADVAVMGPDGRSGRCCLLPF